MFFTNKLSNHFIILKALYIEDFDKFGGEMEFGECSTNTVVQFANL
jgi:hypothetical protein